jgi:glycosyltransferase involved in cell wall biosynthesis
MPFFSVVIALYNKEDFIENTLQSVLNQTFHDFEIIIVNDGSTDKSEEIVLKCKDERINFLSKKNEGVSLARNFGVKNSKSDLIAFLDADDVWFPNHLMELRKLYLDFPSCGMYCNRYRIKTTENHFQDPSFRSIDKSYRGIVENYFYSNRPFRISSSSSLVVPKAIFLELKGFEANCSNGEDVELWTKIGIKYTVAISNKTTVIYNLYSPLSLSKQEVSPASFMNIAQFEEYEKKDLQLKEFLDLHRFFYAIQLLSAGYTSDANLLYNSIDKKNKTFLKALLFKLPPFLLQFLYKIKRKLKKIGVEFSTYN